MAMKAQEAVWICAKAIAERWREVDRSYKNREERQCHAAELRGVAASLADSYLMTLKGFDRTEFLKECFPDGAKMRDYE